MKKSEKQPITTEQIEKNALTVALNDVSKFGKGVFLIAGDIESDRLYAFFNGKFIPAQIKDKDGNNMQLIKQILEYNDDEHAINSFLHFVDAAVFQFSKLISPERSKINKKPMKKK